MGYTHYWRVKNDVPEEVLASVVPDLAKLIEQCAVPLAGPMGDFDTAPNVTEGHVAFNGVGPDAHETFVFPPNMGEDAYRPRLSGDPYAGWVFEFCKTARKPYDAVVVACLLRIEEVISPEWVSISTDASCMDEYMGDEMSEGWSQVNAMFGGLGPTGNVIEETAAQLYTRVFADEPPIPHCFRKVEA